MRICREAVGNAARHAGVDVVEVTFASEPDGVRLRVSDEGDGFRLHQVDRGRFGIQSMTERAAAIGGELSIVTAPGMGTVVELAVPASTSVTP